ncbi:MAG TPA: ribonuclease PH [Candidatus Micrarchaeia archaeon]|nr:ribonuclease PH [Candidatus Micrarchaeia archaeon]
MRGPSASAPGRSPDGADHEHPEGRADGRADDALRPVTIRAGVSANAEGSALIQVGGTRVLCTASIEDRVPAHRRGSGGGWVTAEYAMLPRSTVERTPRDRGGYQGARSQEIQRLIGRALRASVDLAALGARTVIVDCDVLEADGGTRVAAVTGGWVALHGACRRLRAARLVRRDPIRRQVAAVSSGVVAGRPLLDLDYREDVIATTDMNCVGTDDGRLVEVQGTAEGEPFSRTELERLLTLAQAGIVALAGVQREALAEAP